MPTLSKSKIIAFRQCPKRLWLEVHRPELRQDSPATQASFQVGCQVGDIARRIYDPDEVGVCFDVTKEGFPAAFEQSARLLAEEARPVFEAGFKSAKTIAFADVMIPVVEAECRSWKMVEVKSSTGVKDYHRDDVAVQSFLARAMGVNLSSVRRRERRGHGRERFCGGNRQENIRRAKRGAQGIIVRVLQA